MLFRGSRISKQTTQQPYVAITETIVLSLLGVLFGFLFARDFAFFSPPGFTWLLVGPFLSGLYYGFGYALNSSLFLIASMLYAIYYHPSPDWNFDTLFPIALALLMTSLIAGEFRNYWNRQISKLQVSFNYVDHRLEEVTNAFNMLKISHERLAQQAASRSTLRDSILSVRTHIIKAKKADADLVALSSLILKIFSDYGSIQQAGMYVLNDSGDINTEAIAFFGGYFEITPQDTVLQKTLLTLKTTTLKPELVTKEKYSNLLLLAIPIRDVCGHIWGIVLVNKMPFRAFRPDNIRLLSILGEHIADLIGMSQFKTHTVAKDADFQYFLWQVKRCINDIHNFGIISCLVGVQLQDKKSADGLKNLIMGRQRGLDNAWAVKNVAGNECILVLLPLTDIEGADGYKARLEQMVKENYGYADLDEASIKFYKKDLLGCDNLQELMSDIFQMLAIEQSILSH